MPRVVPSALLTVLVLAFTSCRSGPPEPSEAPGAGPPEETFSAADLSPVIREVRHADALPSAVSVELARPVVGPERVGQPAGEETVLRFEPAVEGGLRFTSPSTLTFVPSAPFRPGSTYVVRLESVETRTGTVRAPTPNPWLHRFTTPEFRFVRMAPGRVDFRRRRVEAELFFSAPIEPEEVARHARFTLRDAGHGASHVAEVRYERGREPHRVNAILIDPAVRANATLNLSLAAGTRAAVNPELTAAAADASLGLAAGPPVTIHDVFFAEGTSGFYLEVVCSDDAVAEKRWYWDRVQQRSYGEISRRCVLRESDALESIRFEPAVAFTLSPSGGGFRILGDFQRGSYALRIAAGARTLDGGLLHGDYEKTFSIPARSPRVSFLAKGRYLPRRAWSSLPVQHRNVSRLSLEVRHVPPDNLVFWMGDDESEQATERTSNLVAQHTIAVSGETDAFATSFVDVSTLVPPSTKGLLELTVSAHGTRDTARLLLTDLHLIAKRMGVDRRHPAGRQLQVWTLDSSSLQPLRGVAVKLVRKSGMAVSSCLTAVSGRCTIEIPEAGLDPAAPFALLASKGSDLTYLKFSELRTEVQEERIAGVPYASDDPYRASVYTDRGVYRPGETAHLAAIVRDAEHTAPPAGMPARVTLMDPRGKVAKQQTLSVNGAGMASVDFDFPAFAATGRYEAIVSVAEQPVGRSSFQVEEIVPERMEVDVQATESRYLLGQDVAVDVSARYLFGGLPANHRVELACEIAPSRFEPPENANFHYGVWREQDRPTRPTALGTVTGALDTEASATLSCPGTGRVGGYEGPAELVVRAAVFEGSSGRTSVGRATAPVHPERFYIGLSSSARVVEPGQEVVVNGVVVDWDGQPVADVRSIELELLRLDEEWGYYFDEALGYETYRRYTRPVPEETREVSVENGRFRAVWTPRGHARGYLVRARAEDARTDLALEGKGGWYYETPDAAGLTRTPLPDRPTWLALEAPERVRPGEEVVVTLNAPYRGRVLFTAESDRLIASEWKAVDAGPVRWSFRTRAFVPNVYATALLIKDPHLDAPASFLPDRAFGVRSIAIEPEEFRHPLTLTAPAEVRSRSTLAVSLDLGPVEPETYATVAVVDEGILSLTRFESPDPFRDVFARRALGVETFETVGWTLLVPQADPTSRTGGDLQGMPDRIAPVKPVALWSGLVSVPEGGKLEVTFPLPPYQGALRVMAVTAGPKKMGRADARVLVRDPLVLQTTLPRFLIQNDVAEIPVFVTNLSGAPREVSLSMSVEALRPGGRVEIDPGLPPVEIRGEETQRLRLADGEGGAAVFKVSARAAAGAARIAVAASAGDLVAREELDFPILPAGPRSRRVQRIELSEGTLDLTPYLDGWAPLSERSTFWVTRNPYGDAFDHLKHLIRYPYGCLEQTGSTLRPLLFLPELLTSVDPELVGPEGIEGKVMRGIERLLSMQTAEGGFAYWPGGGEPTYWGTAYATHVLLDAKAERYPVPQARIDDALEWMESQITNDYEKGRTERSHYSANAEPYMHYVLALAGRPRKARAARLVEEIGPDARGEKREHRTMLQAALYLAGDRRYEQELRELDLSTLDEERPNNWSFYSDRRRRGFLLSTYVDLFGADEAAERLATVVADGLRGNGSAWFTTQELAWGITGLGKLVAGGASAFAPPILRAGSREIDFETPPPGRRTTDRVWNVARASELRELTLELPSKSEGRVYLVLSSEGVRETPDERRGGEGLRLERRFLNDAGEPIDLVRGAHTLGDLVYVEIAITNTSRDRIANIALVDRVPAGWEIENPRLGRSNVEAMSWLDPESLWEADHMDLRDDRLEVFGHLERSQARKVLYAVRAVTSGRFTIPSVEAEAMYDPRIWARAGGEVVEIVGPWP